MNDPLVIQCADKVAVREYVKACGCEDILNDLIGVYNSADDIPWDDLPNQFVLKWNFGAGMNIICTDKSKMNRAEVIKQMRTWGKNKYWLPYSEMQYKYIPKKIICEKFLETDTTEKSIPDYKIYCFHGEPKAILVMHDRAEQIKAEFFDCNWIKLDNPQKYDTPKNETPKPVCLEKMIGVARKLSEPFPFVRCDFYICNGCLFFGELTFTPAGGLVPSQTNIQGKSMSEYLHLEKCN